jgi:recombination protein RecT
MNMDNVYEGELRILDKVSGDVDLGGERESDKVIGYFAYIRTVNGFSKTMYWPMDKMVAHAKKYSKSYQQGAAIWKTNFDEMAQKTLMRNLLSRWGIMSVDLQSAINHDNADAADAAIDAQPPIYVNDNTDPETGEILPAQDVKGA